MKHIKGKFIIEAEGTPLRLEFLKQTLQATTQAMRNLFIGNNSKKGLSNITLTEPKQ